MSYIEMNWKIFSQKIRDKGYKGYNGKINKNI